jgi:hypothetical protein
MSDYNEDSSYTKREIIRRGAAVTAGLTGLAGCGGEETQREETQREERWRECGYDFEISEGESYGIERIGASYEVILEDKRQNGDIDIRVVKTILDEEGQNKEGQDAEIVYERSNVSEGKVEKIEGDFRVWYMNSTESGVRLCNGDSGLE